MFLWAKNIRISVHKDKVVILDLEKQEFFCLDGLHALICEKMKSKQFTIYDVIQEIEEYQCDEYEIKEAVIFCINNFKNKNWVIDCEV